MSQHEHPAARGSVGTSGEQHIITTVEATKQEITDKAKEAVAQAKLEAEMISQKAKHEAEAAKEKVEENKIALHQKVEQGAELQQKTIEKGREQIQQHAKVQAEHKIQAIKEKEMEAIGPLDAAAREGQARILMTQQREAERISSMAGQAVEHITKPEEKGFLEKVKEAVGLTPSEPKPMTETVKTRVEITKEKIPGTGTGTGTGTGSQ